MPDRRLHLLRHAKSSWDTGSLSDHDRPLTPRGIRACALLTEHLRSSAVEPDLVLCSSAVRAVRTLDGIRGGLPDDAEVEVDDELYGAATSTLLQRLRQVPDEVRSVLLIGHNPAIGELAASLASDGEGRPPSELRGGYPTATLATLAWQGSWHELTTGMAHLDGFVVARQLE